MVAVGNAKRESKAESCGGRSADHKCHYSSNIIAFAAPSTLTLNLIYICYYSPMDIFSTHTNH